MSKASTWESLAIGFVSIVIGLIGMAMTSSVFNLFFVAIVVYLLWSYTRRIGELEKKVSQLEARSPPRENTATA